ncbi:MAG: ribonuclease P protein component [Chloroflexota bacterium]
MLRAEQRLRRAADIAHVRQEGTAWRHPLLVLLACPNGRSYSRFGFVTSRRIGPAVVRNRVKRRLREVVRQQVDDMTPGWDCLFIARTPIATAKYRVVETAVNQLLQRANLRA